MDVVVLAGGKPSLPYARDGAELYIRRLHPYGGVEVQYVKDSGGAERVGERLLSASEGCLRVALDERGENWSTREMEAKWRDWELHSVKRVAFLIGAADGHSERLREACDFVISLGRHTMQHELALVVLLEQIYRIRTLLAGTPYHRD